MEKHPISQSAHQRACQDTKKFFHCIKFFLGVEVVSMGAFIYLGTVMTPEDANKYVSAAYPAVGAIIGAIMGFLVIYLIMLCLSPYKQRNEARQRIKELENQFKKPKLFDILCPTITLGLPINKLDNGSYQAFAGGISPKPLQILHRGELTTINRFTMTPKILFVRKDKGWETTTAIILLPSSNPLASSRTRDLSWNATNPDQWVLDGLPLTLAKDEPLTLPMLMISVKNGNEVGSRLEKGETCMLTMSFGIFTDKGSPLLPDQQISMTRSDIKFSIHTWLEEGATQ